MSRLCILFLCSLFLAAQTPDTATIQGHVTDQTSAAVAGVDITTTNALTGLKRTVQSDNSGNFSIAGLPIAGAYEIVATKSGFAEARVNVTLQGGATANIELQLNVAGSPTQVNVTGVAGEVRTDEPQLGDRLDARTIESMPLLNRRITFLPLLNAANRPAISQGDVFMNQDLFTTNGAGRRQAWFEVDGVTGNDSWGRQTIFSTVPRRRRGRDDHS